jgi:hypothetical protein
MSSCRAASCRASETQKEARPCRGSRLKSQISGSSPEGFSAFLQRQIRLIGDKAAAGAAIKSELHDVNSYSKSSRIRISDCRSSFRHAEADRLAS